MTVRTLAVMGQDVRRYRQGEAVAADARGVL
jgi:hypothetical protein